MEGILHAVSALSQQLFDCVVFLDSIPNNHNLVLWLDPITSRNSCMHADVRGELQ